MKAHVLTDHPIVSPETPGWDAERIGTHINGPSLIAAPSRLEAPLGRYYLDLAHHQGDCIRLAFAATFGGWCGSSYTVGLDSGR